MVTLKDPETGKMASKIVRTPVIVASVLSGTNHAVNPENASRCFIINTDESRDQTSRIHEHQRLKYSLDRLNSGADITEKIIKTHHAAQRLLQAYPIVNGFAPLLDFPVNLMRLRRDHDRFLDLIACVCYLRQAQKPIKQNGEKPYIECDLEDYAIAYKIMVQGVLSSTVRELPKGAVGLYDELRTWVKQQATREGLLPTEVSFTQREAREITGLSHTWIQVGLRQLVEYEYLSVIRGGGPRSKGHYRLNGDEGIMGADLSMIPTPEIMQTMLGARHEQK
jgi:DNA primase